MSAIESRDKGPPEREGERRPVGRHCRLRLDCTHRSHQRLDRLNHSLLPSRIVNQQWLASYHDRLGNRGKGRKKPRARQEAWPTTYTHTAYGVPGSHGHAITVTCRSEQRHACEALQLRGAVEEWSQVEGPWLQCNNPDRDPWRQLDAFQRCPSQWPMKCRAESGNSRDVKPDGRREPTSFGHDRHGRAQGCTYRAKCKYLAMATSHRLRRQCAGIRGEPRKTSWRFDPIPLYATGVESVCVNKSVTQAACM